jgi:hypothetical protein
MFITNIYYIYYYINVPILSLVPRALNLLGPSLTLFLKQTHYKSVSNSALFSLYIFGVPHLLTVAPQIYAS